MKRAQITVLLLVSFKSTIETQAQHCEISKTSCDHNLSEVEQRYLFYEVSLWEGFNLRRDVYTRLAVMLSDAHKKGVKLNYNLVLPPWHGLVHWHEDVDKTVPWKMFFDIQKLKSFTKIVELDEIISPGGLEIDVMFILHNYHNAFEEGEFKEKWEIFDSTEDCKYNGNYWGVSNINANEQICVRFQGRAAQLWELVALHKSSTKIMFANAETVLHDNYGTKSHWDCRKSMVFNKKLIEIAHNFMQESLQCKKDKCDSYIAVHVRRKDFVSTDRTPSLKGTVKQVKKYMVKNIENIRTVFIATDAFDAEKDTLFKLFQKVRLKPVYFEPNLKISENYTQGGVAIIEQIICSHAAFFIGTQESTFTFRIQEEREILGFNEGTTFNHLCPDTGPCEQPAKWTIVH